MVDVTTTEAVAAPKRPSPPLSTDRVRATRTRSPQKPLTPTPTRSTRSSTMSTNGANGAAVFNGNAPSGPASASGSQSGATAAPHSSKSSQNPSPQRPISDTTPAATRRRKPLFVSCVTYPETSAPVPAAATKDGAEPQRSQRKSKVEALNKIDRGGTPSTVAAGPAATSFVPPPQPKAGPSITRNPLKRPRVVNPPFNLDSVRTSAPVFNAAHTGASSSTAQHRAFGLPTCPTYHPTAEQFRDPMAYIETIAQEAKAYGICKIVPPEGWQMPFSMDTDQFRFMTRLQRLNSIEAASRAKINFLEQLSMFHKQQGDAGAHVPIINHKLLDVWRLRKEVNKLGGIDEVNRLKAWPTITELLGFTPTFIPQIKSAYTKLILPFETWALRAKSYPESPLTPLPTASANGKAASASGPLASPDTPMGAKQQGHMMGMRSSPRGRMSALGAGGSALAAAMTMGPDGNPVAGPSSQAPPSSDSGLAAPIRIKVSGFQTSSHGSDSELSEEESSRTASQISTPPQNAASKYQKGDVCEICSFGNNAAKILLCDGCDRGFHTFCLDPPLAGIPSNEWYCTACLLGNGDDFGFDEGEEHSLASFQARDAAFTNAWFNRYAQAPVTKNLPGPLTRTMGNVVVSEADVEREFWRLVESQDDTVEVEYGADVHSTTHGSAAPTTETHPTSKYARDPWNLNNMAIVRDSLLRYIKSDISGMTVPWIYVGMLFSAFCWHNEDHYTYSVNYSEVTYFDGKLTAVFWGETKTWYGIPGDGAEKFEDAMRREAPELFERQPSLLYQLVTIMNPGRLRDEGVPVYACDQRPNEFVITFPKAYHCGFNHGLNFNEAVNFALPDWLALGKESVDRYREHAKQPVFSHEELLITITLYSDTIKTALWLQDSLRLVVNEETNRRQRIRAAVGESLQEGLVEEDVPEDQYQCCVCKGFCYLSQMTCACTKLVTCLDHHDLLCLCPTENRTLRKRYSEEQLHEILEVVESRASQPETWSSRLDSALQVPRPQLKTIRQLVTDGERIPHDLPGLSDLRDFLAAANSWVERATAVCTRKSTGRRRKGRQSEIAAADEDEVDRSPEALAALVNEASELGFDTPEIMQLSQMVNSMNDFRREAQAVLSVSDGELDYDQARTTLILGQSLNVELPEVAALAKIVARLEWYHKVEEEVDDRTLQYEDIVTLLDEAEANEIPADHHCVEELQRREKLGREWKNKVSALLAAPSIDIDDIAKYTEAHDLVPTSLQTVRQLENIRKTAQGWQQTAQTILANQGPAAAATRLCKAVDSATGPVRNISIPEVDILQHELKRINLWLESIAPTFNVPPSKIGNHLIGMLRELEEHMEPEDDMPTARHSCFCRAPPAGTMIACLNCAGHYHPKCVGISAKSAAGIQSASANFKCQMCQNLQYDDRPTSERLAVFVDPLQGDFIIKPPGYDELLDTIKYTVDYANLVVPLYEPGFFDGKDPAAMHTLVAHLLRKIWTLPLRLTAVRVTPREIGMKPLREELFYEEFLHAKLAEFEKERRGVAKKSDNTRTRARKPKFTFTKAVPHEFHCLCTTEPLDHLLTVQCSKCEQGFHMSCVGAPISATASEAKWRCPFCTIKAGKAPARLDLRCQLPEMRGTDQFIDWRQTIYTYAEEPITVTLPLVNDPARPTVILEISKFTPPAVPDSFEPPVWTELDELGIDKRKRRRTGDAPPSVTSTPQSAARPAMSTPGGGPSTHPPTYTQSPLAYPLTPSHSHPQAHAHAHGRPSASTPSPAVSQPAQNVRTNGSLFYPTHSAVPWENTNMFTQFQINAEPGASRAGPHLQQLSHARSAPATNGTAAPSGLPSRGPPLVAAARTASPRTASPSSAPSPQKRSAAEMDADFAPAPASKPVAAGSKSRPEGPTAEEMRAFQEATRARRLAEAERRAAGPAPDQAAVALGIAAGIKRSMQPGVPIEDAREEAYDVASAEVFRRGNSVALHELAWVSGKTAAAAVPMYHPPAPAPVPVTPAARVPSPVRAPAPVAQATSAQAYPPSVPAKRPHPADEELLPPIKRQAPTVPVSAVVTPTSAPPPQAAN